MKTHLWWPALVLALLCTSSPSAAQSVKDRARTLARQGITLLNQDKPKLAIAKLQRAEELFHAPTHLLYIARAHTRLKQPIEAHQVYMAILAEEIPNYAPEVFHQARKSARDEAAALRPQLALLRIELTGPDAGLAKVKLDAEPLDAAQLRFPIAVTEGRHSVVATIADEEPASRQVTAARGESVVVSLKPTAEHFLPDKSQPESLSDAEAPFPILATTLLALGAASLGVGAATGILTLNRTKDIKAQCDGTRCLPEQQQDADDAKILGHVSTGTFIGGGVLSAIGITLLAIQLTGDSSDSDDSGDSDDIANEAGDAAVQLMVGPTGAMLRGTF